MKALRTQLRLATLSFVVLFVTLIGLLMWLSSNYHTRFDWTRNARNTLAPASVALVETLNEPIRITVFASERNGMRPALRDLIERYRSHAGVVSEFVDPDTDPERVRAAGVQFDGEVLIEYRGNRETVTQASEENITNALARLARSGERWVLFLSGHGERSPERGANFDLSIWSEQMAKRGLKTRTLKLSENPQIPGNTAVLIIADPRTRLLPGEVKQIENYVARGGNVLWFAESGELRGLERLAEALGVEVQSGTIVDPGSRQLTGQNSTFLVVGKYGVHPVVRNLAPTLFPQAVALRDRSGNEKTETDTWQREVILDTMPTAWLETGRQSSEPRFDAGRDVHGPLPLALAMTRDIEKRKQRVVIVGDADFLSNAFLGNGGNLDLGMNLVNWASSDESYIDLPTRTNPDQSLALSRLAQASIVFGFLIILPLFLVGTGIVVWWRRRAR